jgi:hypothetical protein
MFRQHNVGRAEEEGEKAAVGQGWYVTDEM